MVAEAGSTVEAVAGVTVVDAEIFAETIPAERGREMRPFFVLGKKMIVAKTLAGIS